MGFQFWFDFWVPPARHEVIQVDFAKKRILERLAS